MKRIKKSASSFCKANAREVPAFQKPARRIRRGLPLGGEVRGMQAPAAITLRATGGATASDV